LQFKNISPLGELDVPALGALVGPGAIVTATGDLAASFLAQTGTWQALDDDGNPLPVETPTATEDQAEPNAVVDPSRLVYTAPDPETVTATTTEPPAPDPVPGDYGSWTVTQLNAEITARNADRAEEDRIVPDSARKTDLVAALELDDATHTTTGDPVEGTDPEEVTP
jgi:hypothetical protein